MEKELKESYYESVKKRHFNLFLQRDEQATYFEGMMDACWNLGNRLNLNLSGWDDIKDKAIKDAKKDYRFYSDIG